MEKLIVKGEENRLSALEAINHPWFTEKVKRQRAYTKELLTPKMMKNLKNFSSNSLIQREMCHLMVQAFNDTQEIIDIKNIFLSIDRDFSGTIQEEEIVALFEAVGEEISAEEAKRIADSVYFRDRDNITFLEFEAGVLDKSFFTDEERLNLLFNYMDTDHSGYIDPHDIYRIYKRFGKELPMIVVNRMVEESDFDDDGRISEDEFRRIMKSESALKEKRMSAMLLKKKLEKLKFDSQNSSIDDSEDSDDDKEKKGAEKEDETTPRNFSKFFKPKVHRKKSEQDNKDDDFETLG